MLHVERSARAGLLRGALRAAASTRRACCAVALGTLAAVGLVGAGPAVATVPYRGGPGQVDDHLTVTVQHAGSRDGRHELFCHPVGGDHPDGVDACAVLDEGTRWGRDAFAPADQETLCTSEYGGPATAHVTGSWAGRPVDARFARGDGCDIARWDRLVPLLPDLRAPGRS